MHAQSPFRVAERFQGVASSPVRDLLAILDRPAVISFAGGIPDPDSFELDDLRGCFDRVLTGQGRRALQYASTKGEPELREQAALRLSQELPTTPEQVQVTSGSQEGIFVIGQALIDPGDVVLVENPTYLAAIQAFTLAGARVIPVPTDDDGVRPEELEGLIKHWRPKFVYLVPTFQNPTGRTMPESRRDEVAQVLTRTNTVLVEDDPYGELRFEGEPSTLIAAREGLGELAIVLNSASKVIAPGLRVGWLRAPNDILRVLEVAKQAVGLQTGVTDQLVVANYLAHHDLQAHLDRVIALYRSRRDVMREALAARLPNGASLTRPSGGMFLWVDLRDGTDTTVTLPTAVHHGVAYVPGTPFFAGEPSHSTLRLSFVTNTAERLRTGVDRLADSFGW